VENIVELLRLPSPTPKPQAIGFDGTTLWIGSRETHRLYAIDPSSWNARDEGEAPGTPWGLTPVGDFLRVIVGEGAQDDRFIRTFIPGKGFERSSAIACPDFTGSHLSYDGDWLYVSQWYNKRIIGLDDTGRIVRDLHAPHQIAGQTYAGGHFYLLTTDDEEVHQYWLTRLDAKNGDVRSEDLARIDFDARGLAFDGERFWTNHREADQVVAFALPDAE